MRVVVVGATGVIGKAIADLLSDKGHQVVRASRHTQPGVNIGDLASIDAFYATLGEVDAVICAAGNAGYGPLSAVSDEQFLSGVASKLMGQANIVRKGLANLRPGGVFILTGGMLAYTPRPNTSPSSLANAGLEGFVRGAALDLQEGRRIVIVHPTVVRETAIKMGMDGAPWPAAATVAETYLIALESQISGQPVFVEGYGPAR